MTKRSEFEIAGFVVGDLVEHVVEGWRSYVTGIEMQGDRDGFEVILRAEGAVFNYYWPGEFELVVRNPEFEDD